MDSLRLKEINQDLKDIDVKDVKYYNFAGIHPLFDIAVIGTATERQALALVSRVKNYPKFKSVETGSGWTLIATEQIWIHIFTKEERESRGLDDVYAQYEETL